MSDERTLAERVEHLEALVERQAETIAAQHERIDELGAIADAPDRSASISRRTALKAGGLAGLLALGSGVASADPQGQVGTADDPLNALHTLELNSPSSLALSTAGTRVLELGVPAADIGGDVAGGNVLAGHPDNAVVDDAVGVVIGGGGMEGAPNTIEGSYGTVSGGVNNTTAEPWATVGGGRGNTAIGNEATVGGGFNNRVEENRSTISGGVDNFVSGGAANIGGGFANEVTGHNSTVGGGARNKAMKRWATVPGGSDCTANGAFSFAAGRFANTNGNDGAFAWGDGSTDAVTASAPDQFVVQAGGGVTLYSSSDLSSGVELAAGSGTWSNLSASASKANVDPIDPSEVLAGVRDLDVATWNYESQDESIRHAGPMAEDFHEVFGLGGDERRISAVDADGVALAAIQGLAAKLEERDERIDDLETTLERTRQRLRRLETATGSGGPIDSEEGADV